MEYRADDPARPAEVRGTVAVPIGSDFQTDAPRPPALAPPGAYRATLIIDGIHQQQPLEIVRAEVRR